MNDFGQSKSEDSDHIALRRLLQEAAPIVITMYPDQLKKWIAEDPIALEISEILSNILNTIRKFAHSKAAFSLTSNRESALIDAILV